MRKTKLGRILSIVLTVLVVSVLLTATLYATNDGFAATLRQDAPKIASALDSITGGLQGDGNEETYIAQIGETKYTDLHEALLACNAGETVELLGDVTLSGEWSPVDDFKGTFDGKGYTISGLKITQGTGSLGMFANINTGKIKNFTISGANISGATTMTGSKIGVAAAYCYTEITDVTVTGSTVNTNGQYVGGLLGYSTAAVTNCTVKDSSITGKDQVGGVAGYMWCGEINNCTASNNKVVASEERAGGLIGKLQCARDNDNYFSVQNNTITGGSATAPDYAGGVMAQLMGDMANYEIKGNSVSGIVLTAKETNPIATLRNGTNSSFSSVLSTNITGNSWTEDVYDQNSYTYTNVAEGATAQTINNATPFVSSFYEDENGVYHITNLKGLKQFRDDINNYSDATVKEKYNGKTVVLDADIDIGNVAWTPINTTQSIDITFDGQGHTIKNFTVTGEKKVGFFGDAACDTIKNLVIENATVVGINHVAAIAGYGICAHIINCTVKNSSIKTEVKSNDDGDKAGAICGYLSGEGTAEVTGCTVDGCTIRGYRDIGGAVGIANGTATVTGNTVTNTVVINDQENNYKNYTEDSEFDANKVVGETTSTSTVDNNTAGDDVVVTIANKKVVVKDEETGEDKTASVSEEEKVATVKEAPSGATQETQEYATALQNQTKSVTGVKLTDVPTVDDYTKTGLQAVVDAAKKAADDAKKAAVEAATEIKIDIQVAIQPKDVVKSDTTTSSVTISLDPTATVTAVNGSTTTVIAKNVQVTNDMIDQTQAISVSFYTGFKPEQIVHTDDAGNVIEVFSGDQITYDEQTKAATVHISHFSNLTANAQAKVAKVGDTQYETLAEAVYAVTDGGTIQMLVDSVDEALPNYGTSKSFTLKGIADGYTCIAGAVSSAGAGLNENNVTFENINWTAPVDHRNMSGVVFNNCKFTGEYGVYYGYATGKWTFNKCKFEQTADKAVHFDEGKNVAIEFTNCTIRGKINGLEAGYSNTATFTNCTFDGGVADANGKYYAEIKVRANTTFTNCTFTQKFADGRNTTYDPDDNGINIVNGFTYTFTGCSIQESETTVDTLVKGLGTGSIAIIDATQNEKSQYTAGTFKTTGGASTIDVADGYVAKAVEGKDNTYAVQEKTYVAQIGDTKYETLADAITAAKDYQTEIDVIADIDYGDVSTNTTDNTGVTVPDGKNIVLDLNGHKIEATRTNAKSAQTILNKGVLTIKDSSEGETGLIKMHAGDTTDPWKVSSSAISNSRDLTILGGTIESGDLGGSYGIDSLQNSYSYDVNLWIKGGYIKSTYRGVRLFANSTNGSDNIYFTDGTVEGGEAVALWIQNPNSNANKVKAEISGNAKMVNPTGAAFSVYSENDNGLDLSVTGGYFNGSVSASKEGFITGGYYSNVGKWTYTGGKSTTKLNQWFAENADTIFGGNVYTIDTYNQLSAAQKIEYGYRWDYYGIYGDDGYWFTYECTPSDTFLSNIAVGYSLLSNSDSTYKYKVGKAVASITSDEVTTYYGSLEDAVAAATDNQTIKLLADITPSDIVKVEGKTITIDLAGKTVSRDIAKASTTAYGTASSQPVLWVGEGANLTMTDSVGGGEVKSTTKGAAINVGKYSGGSDSDAVSTLTLKAGTYTGAYTGCYAFYNGKIIVDGATVNGADVGICVRNQGSEVTVNSGTVTNSLATEAAIQGNGTGHGTTITINGGEVTGKGCGIYQPQNGTLNINGGTITGAASAVEVRAGTINVIGGVLVSTASTYTCTSNGNGFTTIGAALAIAQHTTKLDITANISGGAFSGVKAISESNPQNNDPAPTVTMSVIGGLFKGEITMTDALSCISGGVYSVSPDSKYLASGKSVITNTNSTTKNLYPFGIGTKTEDIVIRDKGETTEVTVNVNTTVDYSVQEEQGGIEIPEDVKEQIETKTIVQGVELQKEETVPSGGSNVNGVQAVVNAAKTQAVTDKNTEFTNAVAASSMIDTTVTVDVDIKVKAIEYNTASESGNIKFDLTPIATVTIKNGDETAVTQQVEVTNEMIDTTKPITVTLYTGFKPVQLIHKDDDGKLIDTYYPADTATSDQKTFSYNETTGVATAVVYHFSTMNAVKEGTVVSTVAKIGNTEYESLADAVAAVKNGETIVLLADNSETITVSTAKSFTLDSNGKAFTGSLNAGEGLTKTVDGSTYTFAETTYEVTLTSAISGTTTTIAAVSGGGSIGSATGTTISAPNVSGYSFKGWYKDYTGTVEAATLVDKNNVYTFKPTEDISLTAVYEVNTGTTFNLTVNGNSFTVNGEMQASQYQDDVAGGTSLTIAYTGTDKFLYWRNGSKALVSTTESFTTTLVADTEFTAVTASDIAGSAMVVFKNLEEGGQQLSAKRFSSTSTITFPSNPSCYGKTFKYWAVTVDDVAVEATQAKIQELIANGATYLVVYGYFEKTADYTVTVHYMYDGDDMGANNFDGASGTQFTVEAPSVSGYDFSAWKVGGKIVSTNASYSFVPSGSMDIYCYMTSGDPESLQNIVNFDGVTASMDSSKYKLTMKSTYSISNGTVIKSGFLYWTSGDSEFTYENRDNIKYYEWDQTDSSIKSGSMILNILNKSADTTIYYRSYVVVQSGDETSVVYSAPVDAQHTYSGYASYNSLKGN